MSNVNYRGNRERQQLPKQNHPWCPHSFPWGTPCSALPQPEEKGNLHRPPQPEFAVWHMLQGMTCFTHLLPHGPMETGFREASCTFLGSHTHFQHLPCHITACLCGCYDLGFFKWSFKTAFFQVLLFGIRIRVKDEGQKSVLGLFSLWLLTELS